MPNEAAELVALVNAYHEYKFTQSGGIASFCQDYLQKQVPDPAVIEERTVSEMKDEIASHHPFEKSQELGYLFGRLSRFARFESSRCLPDSGLKSFEEILMVNHIGRLQEPSKKQVIEASMVEYTTGIEVIKRLLNSQNITEFENNEDRRSKKIKLTSKGQQALIDSQQALKTISQNMFDSLSPIDQTTLATLLHKLNDHHTALRNG
jgi:DNA-binding MarR family transcriptional regulator